MPVAPYLPATGGGSLQAVAYRDTWADGLPSFLSMMHERLLLMKDLLAEDGTLYLHCDWRSAPHMRLLLDEIFGPERFLGDIVWHYTGGGRSRRWFSRKHDRILHYAASKNWFFNPDAIRVPYKPGSGYAKGGIVSAAGKRYLPHPEGTPADDVWDIPMINPLAAERNGYPTQKPERLLERIVQASSRQGDLVADFFCGSGGMAAVAERLGRRWIAVDNAPLAFHATRKRLLSPSRPAAFSLFSLPEEDGQACAPVLTGEKDGGPVFRHVARLTEGECGYAVSDVRAGCRWGAEGLICRLEGFRVDVDFRARQQASEKSGALGKKLRALAWRDWLDYWGVGTPCGPDFAVEHDPAPALCNDVVWREAHTKGRELPLHTPELSLPEPEGGSGPSVLVLTLVDIFANECRCLLPVPQRP